MKRIVICWFLACGFSINFEKIVYTPQISPLFRLKDTKITILSDDESCLVEVAGVAPASKVATSAVLHG
jgi:hypothetical protein